MTSGSMNVHNSAFFSPLSPSPSHARSCHKSGCEVKSCHVVSCHGLKPQEMQCVCNVCNVCHECPVCHVCTVCTVCHVCNVCNVCHVCMSVMYVMYVMSYPVLPCHVVVCASTQQCYFVVNDSMFWLSLQTYLASVGRRSNSSLS